MEDKRFNELLDKYITGTATVEEQLELLDWYNLKNNGDILWQAEADEEENLVHNRLLSNIAARLSKPKTKKLWPRWVAAASIALAVMTGGYFYYANQIVNRNSTIVNANDIAPGKNGATLTLANGKKIYINDALAGNIANESGVKISKTKDGQIVYTVPPLGGDAEGRGSFNTLTTTRGEQTQVRLPDGTLVFLNAESSLRYPTSFAKTAKREVVLTGEGYFEVAKDKKRPFVVQSESQKVEVLGTHFNINTYNDESSVRTTLLEGSVKVNGKILMPNQQSSLFSSGRLTVKEVNGDDVVAWKEGLFVFDREPLENIMKKLSRWYNVEVAYRDDTLRAMQFSGSVSRFSNISSVLNKLELAESVKFEVRGRKVMVHKNSK